jgi:hypothetical protein
MSGITAPERCCRKEISMGNGNNTHSSNRQEKENELLHLLYCACGGHIWK